MAKSSFKKPVVIIEIGNDWLKMIQAEPSRGGASISRIHLEKVGAGSVSQSISKALKKLKFAAGPVIACLPRHMVNIRILELPSTESDEIEDMVDLQVGKQTPYSKEEIVSDYRIIGSERAGYTKVMLAIVQRSVARERFHILEEAGVEVERMSVSSEGILNWYAHAVSSDGGAGVLLDIDSFYSDLMVVANGRPVFTRSILVGADQLLADYEKSKEKFAREVKRSLEICQGETPGLIAGKLFITGAGPNIKGLSEYLGGQLEIVCDTADCLSSVKKLPRKPDVRSPAFHPVSLTPLIGIALAPQNMEFNLTPDSVKLRKGLVEKAKSLTTLGMLVMTVLISVSTWTTLKFYFKRDRLNELRENIRKTEPTAKKLEEMRAIIKAVEGRRDPRFSAVNLLADILPRVPEDIRFSLMDFNIDDKAVRLGGLSGSRPDVSTLVKNLEKSALFKDVKVEGALKRDRKSDKYSFLVVCTLEKEK